MFSIKNNNVKHRFSDFILWNVKCTFGQSTILPVSCDVIEFDIKVQQTHRFSTDSNDYPNTENFIHSFILNLEWCDDIFLNIQNNSHPISSTHDSEHFHVSLLRACCCFLSHFRLFDGSLSGSTEIIFTFSRECRHHISTTSTEIRRQQQKNTYRKLDGGERCVVWKFDFHLENEQNSSIQPRHYKSPR